MEWSFNPSQSPEFIRIVTSGVFSSTQFSEMYDDLTSLEYWRFGTPLLFDNRKLDLTAADPLELMKASDLVVSRNPELAFTPIATLFDSPESMEIGERFGQITDHRSLADVRRFLKEAEAVEWLTSYFLSILAIIEFSLHPVIG